jgi:PST family polysaccharide transporter
MPAQPSVAADRKTRLPQSFLTGRAGLYLGARYGLGVVISLGNMFVLTWLIGPHTYGVFITVITLTSVLASLVRSGLDTYLVRCEKPPTRRDYDTASTAILIFSVLAMLAGSALIPLLIRWFHSREFVPAYLVTMLTIPIAGVAGPVTAKLERSLAFRAVAQIELTGQSVALLTGLTLALLGQGIWSPVAGQLVWQTFSLLAAFRAARYVPRFRLELAPLRRMLAFGVGVTASQRTWQLRALVNPLIVGRFAGPEGIAFVGLAIRIAESLGFLRAAASRLALASLSRVQNDADLLRNSLASALRGQLLILGPLLAFFAIASPLAIHRFLGDRWLPVQFIYPPVAFAVLVNSIFNLQASALFVVGRQWLVLRAFAIHVALLGAGAMFLVPRAGLIGYGIADVVACAAYPWLQIATSKAIGPMPRSHWMWIGAFAAPLLVPYIKGFWRSVPCAVALLIAACAVWAERKAHRDKNVVPVAKLKQVLIGA